jgi:hypothetical protein
LPKGAESAWSRAMQAEPFFHLDGERFIPTAQASGTWAQGSLHGRAVVGVVGLALERRHGDPAFLPTRLTVDLYRMPPAAPFEIRTRVLREGRSLRLVEGELVAEGKSHVHATLLFLRAGEPPAREVWSRPPWDAPPPSELPDAGTDWTLSGRWLIKPISGFRTPGPRRAWTRETRELVGGIPHTPFSRVAAAADLASPFAHSHREGGLDYINTDMTLYCHRPMVGEWVGFETADHGATAGVAAGACFLHDETGPIGFGACAALHKTHPPLPAS